MASFQLYDPDIACRDVSVVQSQVPTGIEGSGLLWPVMLWCCGANPDDAPLLKHTSQALAGQSAHAE